DGIRDLIVTGVQTCALPICLILFFLMSISGLIGGSWGRVDAARWTPAQLKKLAITGCATIAALFINPFGWRLVYYPFDLAFKQRSEERRVGKECRCRGSADL